MMRFSGLRLPSEEGQARVYSWAALIQSVMAYAPIIQMALDAPFGLDDRYRGLSPKAIFERVLIEGEFFAFFSGDKFVGFSIFYGITPQRSAYWGTFAMPEFRLKSVIRLAAKDLIEYAFKPWPEGLGLIKLKADVPESNRPALRATSRLGFVPIGASLMEGLYYGKPENMILLELLNPAVFKPVIDEVKSDGNRGLPTSIPESSGPGTGSSTTSPEYNDSASTKRTRNRKAGTKYGKGSASVPSARKRTKSGKPANDAAIPRPVPRTIRGSDRKPSKV